MAAVDKLDKAKALLEGLVRERMSGELKIEFNEGDPVRVRVTKETRL